VPQVNTTCNAGLQAQLRSVREDQELAAQAKMTMVEHFRAMIDDKDAVRSGIVPH
jgi:hypothetical protein